MGKLVCFWPGGLGSGAPFITILFITKIPSKPPTPQMWRLSFHVTKAWLPSGISLSLALLVFLMKVEAWRIFLNLMKMLKQMLRFDLIRCLEKVKTISPKWWV